MHGAGNDYVYIDGRGTEENWSEIAISVSDRHKGIGSDGLILAKDSDIGDVKMVMFNSDGSQGQMCGNGIRCLVKFAFDKNIVPTTKESVVVDTASGTKIVTPIWEEERMVSARVDMGEPSVALEDIPAIAPGHSMIMDYPIEINGETIKINCASMGNPHAIAFIETPVEDYPLDKIGPLIEHHKMFPDRTNFEIVNLINQNHVKARVWERGSGLTEACGTGACAIVAITRLRRLTQGNVTVSLPGGDLEIEWTGDGGVIMEGPVATVFEGDWNN